MGKKEFVCQVTDGFKQRRDVLSDGRVVSTVKINESVKVMDNFLSMLPDSDRPYDKVRGDTQDFETMVFASEDDFDELDVERYSTPEEAHLGHLNMVEKWATKAKRDEQTSRR
jgi:hypothetical protein